MKDCSIKIQIIFLLITVCHHAVVVVAAAIIEAKECQSWSRGSISLTYGIEKKVEYKSKQTTGKGLHIRYGKANIFINQNNQNQMQSPINLQQQQQQQNLNDNNANIVNNLGNLNNVNDIQTMSGLPIQSQSDPLIEGVNITESNSSNTVSAPEDDIVSWFLSVPITTQSITFAQIEDGKAHSPIDIDEFKNSTTVVISGDNKVIDITAEQLPASDDQWYIICLNHSIVEEGELSWCRQCQLLRSCNRSTLGCSNQDPISIAVADQWDSGIALRVQVNQFPLPTATLTTRVTPQPRSKRCYYSGSSPDSQQLRYLKEIVATNPLYPQTITYAKIIGLSSSIKYQIESIVGFEIDNKNATNLPKVVKIGAIIEQDTEYCSY